MSKQPDALKVDTNLVSPELKKSMEIFTETANRLRLTTNNPQLIECVTSAIRAITPSIGKENQNLLDVIADMVALKFFSDDTISQSGKISWVHTITDALPDYNLLHIYPENALEEDKEDFESVENRIIEEIFIPDEKKIITNESPVIVLSPINDDILKYLSEHPEEMYNLSDDDFESFMAEIYDKLGYNVTRTQQTRDGGKDIIIRKPEAMGDFIYYVECKKYAAKRHIGVGILRNLVGTINTDRVNGGILATTSFFTKDARQFVMENKLQYQVKMQDYDAIRSMLTQVV